MAGIHADRGDKSHRLVCGTVPQVGMFCIDNDLKVVVLSKVVGDGEWDAECGWYCKAWHTTSDCEARSNISNCERLTTQHPKLRAYLATHPHRLVDGVAFTVA